MSMNPIVLISMKLTAYSKQCGFQNVANWFAKNFYIIFTSATIFCKQLYKPDQNETR